MGRTAGDVSPPCPCEAWRSSLVVTKMPTEAPEAASRPGGRLAVNVLKRSRNRNGVALDHGAPLHDCIEWAMFAFAFSKRFCLNNDSVRFRPYRDLE